MTKGLERRYESDFMHAGSSPSQFRKAHSLLVTHHSSLATLFKYPRAFNIDSAVSSAHAMQENSQSGQAKMQERMTQKREMRQSMQMKQRMARRSPRAPAPAPFPVLPAPVLLSLSCYDPSTQTGTPRWTHHPVTYSKQTTGVEPARNFIPAPSTLDSFGLARPVPPMPPLLPLPPTAALLLTHRSHTSAKPCKIPLLPISPLKGEPTP